MKKLTVILTLLIALCVSGVAAAQDYSDVPEDSRYYEPILRLTRLAVVGGYPDGSFGIDQNITRAEVAVLAVRMGGNGDNATIADSPFTDVPNDYWAAAPITFCAQNGIMNGIGDNLFAPDENITDEELITLLVRLCGGIRREISGKYPDIYIREANLKNITMDYDYEIGHVTNRGEAALLLKNALDAPLTIDDVIYDSQDGNHYKTLYTTVFSGIYPEGMNFASCVAVKSDTTIKINYNTINSYLINGNRYIFAECLEEQGFDVTSDENGVYVTRDLKEIPDCMIEYYKAIGTYHNLWSDDKYDLTGEPSRVYLDGELVESYAVTGGHLISVDALERYDKYTQYDIFTANMKCVEQGTLTKPDIHKFDDPTNNITLEVQYTGTTLPPEMTVKWHDEENDKYYRAYYVGSGRYPYTDYCIYAGGECDENWKLKNGVIVIYNKVSSVYKTNVYENYEKVCIITRDGGIETVEYLK